MDTSDLPTAVAEYLFTNRQELYEITETLVGYETQNPPGRTVDIVEWLETTLKEPTLSLERCEVDPEKPNLIVTLPGRSDHTLCFNGHLDTVPFDESDWTYDPLGERDGDRIYGRGASDMKGAAGVDTRDALGGIRNCLTGMDGIEITDLSWTRGSYEPMGSPIVEASARSAEHVVNDQVYRRSATGGGDAKVLRYNGIPTVEFGFGTQTAHGTDEYTTTEALVRNAVSYGTLPVLYEQLTSGDR
jgi:acetylornithine deacetylase/succinyl-diaminopimelate desuccinylase-like protein